jgi:hypothetical protein
LNFEINLINAGLWFGMASAGVPIAIDQLHAADPGHWHAAPLAFRRKSGPASTGELKCQHLFAATFSTDDMGADVSLVSLILTSDLLSFSNGLPEQIVAHDGHSNRFGVTELCRWEVRVPETALGPRLKWVEDRRANAAESA